MDVTEKLMNIFREAKRDGEALKAKYPLAEPSLLRIHSNLKHVRAIKLIETLLLFRDFSNLVKSWAPYDIKRRCSWVGDLQYIFDGYIIDFDDTGNLTFGVIAKATGISDFLSQLGAGLINFKEALETVEDLGEYYNQDELEEAVNRELSWWSTYFDDPRDNAAIKKGFKYYDKL